MFSNIPEVGEWCSLANAVDKQRMILCEKNKHLWLVSWLIQKENVLVLVQVHVPNAQWGQTNRNSGFGAEKGLFQFHARWQLAYALKPPELPERFQQSICKSQFRERGRRVCDQLMHNSDWLKVK